MDGIPGTPFIRIPAHVLPGMINRVVHVSSWCHGCVFIYKGTTPEGEHMLRTPKTQKGYTTFNDLEYVRSDEHKAVYYDELWSRHNAKKLNKQNAAT